MIKRQRFTAEFKREAVRLLDAGERPASEVAIDLGIRRNQLYKWKAELVRSGELSFLGPGRKPGDQDSEIARLKRELARVTEERDVLKKAGARGSGRSGSGSFSDAARGCWRAVKRGQGCDDGASFPPRMAPWHVNLVSIYLACRST